MKETPLITAQSTSYPEKVDAFVEHNLSGALQRSILYNSAQ